MKPNEGVIYEFIKYQMELYDQAVRNVVGGEMGKYFQQPVIINEQFVLDRIGSVGKSTRQYYLDMLQRDKDATI